MKLKSDLEKLFSIDFWEGYDGESTDAIEVIADEVVSYYKESVSKATDIYGNLWTISDFSTLKNAIENQFNIAFKTSQPLQFNLIETAVISIWSTATLKLPAAPAPGQSIVNSGIITSSTPPGIPPLPKYTTDQKIIAERLNNLFTKHSKSISYNYIGLAISGTPPPPLTVSGSTVDIK